MPTDKTEHKYNGKTVTMVMDKRQPPLEVGERAGFTFKHACKLVELDIAHPAYEDQWEQAKKENESKKADKGLPSQEEFVGDKKYTAGKGRNK